MSARMIWTDAVRHLEKHGLGAFRRDSRLCVRRDDRVIAIIPIDVTRTYSAGNYQTVASLTVDAVARGEQCSATVK